MVIAAMWIAWLTRRFPRTLRRVARSLRAISMVAAAAEFAGWCAVGELGEASGQDPVVDAGEEDNRRPGSRGFPSPPRGAELPSIARTGTSIPSQPINTPTRQTSGHLGQHEPGTRDGAGRPEQDTAEPDLNHQPGSSAAVSGGPSSPVRLRPRRTCKRAVRS
jgi:hypothetical protein